MYDPGRARLESALNELELVHPDIKRSNAAEDILSLGVHVCDKSRELACLRDLTRLFVRHDYCLQAL